MLNYPFKIFSKFLVMGIFILGFSFSASGQRVSTELPLEVYTLEEALEAAQGFFGDEYSEGLQAVLERAFADKGAPDAYYFGEEDAGIFEIGYRYGQGRVFSKNLKSKKVYWRGPSIGFDLVGGKTKVFTLVYNLRDHKSLYKRLVSGETGYYFFGGAAISYKKRLEMILAQIRVGVELSEGLNPAWIKLGPEKMVVPNVLPK